jgi:diphthamide synthase (EF-2-diphthine--ammonia ligase)
MHTHIGKSLGQVQAYFESIKVSHGLNVCGEGGEYETFCIDAPFFKKRIQVCMCVCVCVSHGHSYTRMLT